MTNKELALSYLEKGFSVIPVWSPEMVKTKPTRDFVDNLKKALAKNKDNGSPISEEEIFKKHITKQCKIPVIKWREFETKLPTKDQVHHWFTMNPDANIGIITGKVSGIVVFDLDSPEAVEYAEEMGGFPETVKVKTKRVFMSI